MTAEAVDAAGRRLSARRSRGWRRTDRESFDCWQRSEEHIAAVGDHELKRRCRVDVGAWLSDARPFTVFWTQTWRPRPQALYGLSIDYVRARMRALLERGAREVCGLSRGDVARGAVYGWCSWEKTKAGAWHAHLLVGGLPAEAWRELKEFAFRRDGIARIHPIAPGEERMNVAVYVSKYVAKSRGEDDDFDVFGDWRRPTLEEAPGGADSRWTWRRGKQVVPAQSALPLKALAAVRTDGPCGGDQVKAFPGS